MFEDLQPAPADKILALIGLYRADPRPGKVDLGVGVYKDRDGKTPVMRAASLQIREYPYFEAASGAVRFADMMSALATAKSGDVVLLHGCCHNPTGANLDTAQWAEIADLVIERGLLPFVDIAYQGFGEGLDADATGLRLLAEKVPEMVVASSCSKNFAVYRDRVGAAMILAKDSTQADVAMSQMLSAARAMYSMPPDHGAAAVRIVLEDATLRADWEAELEEMRLRMLRLRVQFAEALRRQSNSDRFDFVASHRGMFSRLGLSEAQVERLRAEHGVYMVGDSRINVAGLPEDGMDALAKAIVSVLD
ncbi:MAG: aspartate/tyrosine/aromatic aminotransferase [Mesorhizobium sp.]|uniref:amino acid aminotransferase n=1 Tax=Mesorhizobium sp. TaxID=1871066 RepID=UPI000FE6600D|nr:aminotransferase class I/II-fold pyridoxal phosphate-dependent enzyme [Mesorhizobium sp.]RWH51350.1 MAG: aspartate/tyrosine/aromatic aminotransferase [Mesorhizobium sp.]